MPPELPDTLQRLSGVLSLDVSRVEGLHVLDLTMSDDGALLAAVLRETIESGAEVYECQTRQVSLEEIYLHTLGDIAEPRPPEVRLW
jgi:hypothetical protein